MITVHDWKQAATAAEQEHARRDRDAIGAGLRHVRRLGWKVDLPPNAPVYDGNDLVVTPDTRELYINIADLAVATMLVGRVRWVRVEPAGSVSGSPTVKELFRTAARQSRNSGVNDFLILGCGVGLGRIVRWFLRPSDLLTQGREPDFAPSTWSAWKPDGVFVAGLPKLAPQDAVRKAVAAWVTRGRRDQLPWESGGGEVCGS